MAIGTKWWPGFGQQSIFLLLSGFSSCGYSYIASLLASDMYKAAKVSTQVKSKTRQWPDFHGAMHVGAPIRIESSRDFTVIRFPHLLDHACAAKVVISGLPEGPSWAVASRAVARALLHVRARGILNHVDPEGDSV